MLTMTRITRILVDKTQQCPLLISMMDKYKDIDGYNPIANNYFISNILVHYDKT